MSENRIIFRSSNGKVWTDGINYGTLNAGHELVRDMAMEIDRLKQHEIALEHAFDCIHAIFGDPDDKCGSNVILPDFLKLGEDKFKAVCRLAIEYKKNLKQSTSK